MRNKKNYRKKRPHTQIGIFIQTKDKLTDNKSFEYSHNWWHRLRGWRCNRCGKLSLEYDTVVGHWLTDGRPVNLSNGNQHFLSQPKTKNQFEKSKKIFTWKFCLIDPSPIDRERGPPSKTFRQWYNQNSIYPPHYCMVDWAIFRVHDTIKLPPVILNSHDEILIFSESEFLTYHRC